MNKRGGMFDLIVLMVVAFVAVVFFGGWMYGSSLLTESLLDIPTNNGINITDATEKTFSKVDESLQGLRWLAFAIIIGSIISIFVSNFLVRAHPVFLIPYVLFIIISVIFSAYISNAYESILQSNLLGGTLQQFGAANYFLTNLPVWITIIGMIGAIFLFIGVTVDRDSGGGLT